MNQPVFTMTTLNRRHRRRFVVAAVLSLGALHGPAAWAQSPAYPTKAITFVVPFAAGSATDQLARVLGQSITNDTKQPVIVDNKAGASGMIAAAAVAKAPADGQSLTIQRGFVVFSGPIDNPVLDIVALRPNYTSDQRVGVQVMGSALLPRVRLYSEPALPDNQTLAWLLLGRPAPNSGAEAAMLQSAALALLGGREGRGLAANFGLDELSFSGGGDGELSSASVTLGKRLSDRLYAAYEHSLAGTGGTLMIFLELSRRWTLRGQAGENSAVDLIYRLTFD